METRLFLTSAETIRAISQNARRVMNQGVGRTFVLSLLAGFYIAFGAQLTTVVTQDASLYTGQGIARLLGGSVFSIGRKLQGYFFFKRFY